MEFRGYRLTDAIRSYVARSAIGASSVRGQPRGVLAAARYYAGNVNIGKYSTDDAGRFARLLDRDTEAMRASFPRAAQFWGVARKALNLFLRDALYNHYLRQFYKLDCAEHLYEVPLDSAVAKALADHYPDSGLPVWRTVKGLSQNESMLYQDFLGRIAREKRIARVHLDAYLWTALSNSRLERPSGPPARALRRPVTAGRSAGNR